MKDAMKWIGQHNKAIFGFLTSGVIMYLQVHDHGVTADEWLQILGAAFAGGGVVWLVPNTKKEPNVGDKV